MPNGRNSGRLYPGMDGDKPLIKWSKDKAHMVWEKEGTVIAPMSFNKDEAIDFARRYGMEFVEV